MRTSCRRRSVNSCLDRQNDGNPLEPANGIEWEYVSNGDMAVCSFRQAGGRGKVDELAAEPGDTWH